MTRVPLPPNSPITPLSKDSDEDDDDVAVLPVRAALPEYIVLDSELGVEGATHEPTGRTPSAQAAKTKAEVEAAAKTTAEVEAAAETKAKGKSDSRKRAPRSHTEGAYHTEDGPGPTWDNASPRGSQVSLLTTGEHRDALVRR